MKKWWNIKRQLKTRGAGPWNVSRKRTKEPVMIRCENAWKRKQFQWNNGIFKKGNCEWMWVIERKTGNETRRKDSSSTKTCYLNNDKKWQVSFKDKWGINHNSFRWYGKCLCSGGKRKLRHCFNSWRKDTNFICLLFFTPKPILGGSHKLTQLLVFMLVTSLNYLNLHYFVFIQ